MNRQLSIKVFCNTQFFLWCRSDYSKQVKAYLFLNRGRGISHGEEFHLKKWLDSKMKFAFDVCKGLGGFISFILLLQCVTSLDLNSVKILGRLPFHFQYTANPSDELIS